MKKRTRSGEVAAVVVFVVATVVILLVAPRYPTMIERRIEARRIEAESAYRSTQPDRDKVKTLEVIMPDGSVYELETFLDSHRKQ